MVEEKPMSKIRCLRDLRSLVAVKLCTLLFVPLPYDSSQVVNVPSFIVHIDFSLKSTFVSGRPGHVKRKNAKKGDGAGEEEAKD